MKSYFKKLKNKNIFIFIATFSTFLLFIPIISKKPKLLEYFTSINTKDINDENIYKNAKAETMYPVKTVRKVGDDANKINVLFLGDNYGKEDNVDEFWNHAYDNVVVPWLSTTYPAKYDNSVTLNNHGTRIPFQLYLNDKINVYSIQPNFKTNDSIVDSKDTFFGTYISSNSSNSFLKNQQWSSNKIRVLVYDASKNFLQDNGTFSSSTVALVRKNGYGRPNAPDFYRTTTFDNSNTHVHEMGHSIYGLVDEYPEGSAQYLGPNRIYLSNKNEIDKISWKEFLNFRGIGLYKVAGFNNHYTPTKSCIMNNSHDVILDFCEVCIHHMIKIANKVVQDDLFYIADPQLTPKHGEYNSNEPYSIQHLQSQELYKFNIASANNEILEFRTVIDNMTLYPRKVKLRIKIFNDNNQNRFFEESEEFLINPQEIKGLSLITKQKAPSDLKNYSDDIIGEVVDVETNEVLATNLDRFNTYYLTPSNGSNISEAGTKIYKVTINFKDKATNNPLPNIKPTTLIKRNGSKFKLEKILFNGYRLDLDQSNINGNEITINGQDLTFNYYYDALLSKRLKLKLIDNNNQIIKQKEIKVFEGQTFTPESSDFFIYDLENYGEHNKDDNENWTSSVVVPSQTYNYDQIQDNVTELTYSISNEIPSYGLSRNINLIQGEDINNFKHSSINKQFLANWFNNKFEVNSNEFVVIWNNVDTSKVGQYNLVYYLGDNSSNINNKNNFLNVKVNVIENKNYIPDPLEAEKNRLNSMNLIWIDKLERYKGSMEDFESINQNNLLSNIANFNFDNTNFNYEVIDFSKLYPGVNNEVFLGYKFKIRISSKTTKNYVETNQYSKYIWLNSDAPITPPTDVIELENEINRINGLNLSLKKSDLTQEEALKITKDNILQNVNNWISMANFAYEVTNFKNQNNQYKFSITVAKNGNSQTSKEFTLSYNLITSPTPEENENQLLQNEINRINGLINSTSLNVNSFTQEQIDSINETNFSTYLSNWTEITKNKDKYSYQIIELTKTNNQFNFKIKVINNKQTSLYSQTNVFNLSYKIITNIDPILLEEKNRIDKLDLKLNKNDFNQLEINDLINNPNSITKYLDGWSEKNDFVYEFKIVNLSNQFDISILIKKTNVATTTSLLSKTFTFKYNMVASNNGNNNLPLILGVSIGVPAAIVIGSSSAVIIYKNKKRKY